MTGVLWVRGRIESFLNYSMRLRTSGVSGCRYPERLPAPPPRKQVGVIWVGFWTQKTTGNQVSISSRIQTCSGRLGFESGDC